MWRSLKKWVNKLRQDTLALWFVCRDERTPLFARVLGFLIVAYALSPIDLIPDFIPIIGYLDELILLPLGIWILLKLIPTGVMSENRVKAEVWLASGKARPRSVLGGVVVVLIWTMIALWMVFTFASRLNE